MKKPSKPSQSKSVPDKRSITVASSAPFSRWRFYLILFFIFVAFALLVGRAAFIQIIEPDNLIHQSDLRSVRSKTIHSARGIISDRNGEALAVSVPVEAVWADPATIIKKGSLQDKNRWYALADVLGLDRQGLIKRIKDNDTRRFIYLQRQVNSAMANYIRELKLPGVGLKAESRRYYPAGEVSAHTVGVTGIDGHGLEGVERSYDKWLTGEAGKQIIRKDRYGRVVENISLEQSEAGKPLQLTIDQRIQAIAFRAVKQAMADYRATSASAVMVDVKTGEVLAMVNAPSYNPNNRADYQNFKMRNRVITDAFEPGSTVKPFVVLAALENGVADTHTIIDIGDGTMRIGGAMVRDSDKIPGGKASLQMILKKSSNVGVSKLSLKMPIEAVLGMYSSVGLGETSGLNLPGESIGIFPNRQRWSDFERATIAFGYGLAITPIQLAHAYATLGNMGKYQPLHLIEGHRQDNLEHQVASTKNVHDVLEMLETVTQKGGTAVKAAVPGYRIAAKTGTSRKAIAGGYSDEYFAYTAGVAPVSNPRLSLVVMVNEPQGDSYYGGAVAGPVFSEIMKGALQILNIAPDENRFEQDKKELSVTSMTNKGRALADLLSPWLTIEIPTVANVVVTELHLDSRRVTTGSTFVAIVGHAIDGRQFITKAIAQGATAVIAQADEDHAHGVIEFVESVSVVYVEQLHGLLSALAGRLYGAHHNRPIAVTGTNGKTTITQLIAQWMTLAGRSAAVMGTTGNGFLDALVPAANTTGNAIDIQAQLSTLAEQGAHYTALEVSSHGLVQGRVKALHFAAGVFTNLSRDHLDYHGTMEAYAEAKKSLFTEHQCDVAIINADDAVGAAWLTSLDNPIGVSLHQQPNTEHAVWATQVDYADSGIRMSFSGAWGEGEINVPLIGEFNASNVLVAFTTLLALGFDKATLLSAATQLKPVIGRMELFQAPNKAKVVVDYAHTPDALEKALTALRVHCGGKLWAIFGCGGDRDKGKRPLMAQVAEKYADNLILTDDNPRSEQPEQIIKDMLAGLVEPNNAQVEHHRFQALAFALAHASVDDIILLAGKGHEDYQILGDNTIHYSDRESAQTLLELKE